MSDLPERDWKYLRSIRETLLSELCRRINEEAVTIATSEAGSDYEKYIKLFKHVEASDKIVANCFDDWRRSTLFMRLISLRNQKLLSDAQIDKLSEECRSRLARFYS